MRLFICYYTPTILLFQLFIGIFLFFMYSVQVGVRFFVICAIEICMCVWYNILLTTEVYEEDKL